MKKNILLIILGILGTCMVSYAQDGTWHNLTGTGSAYKNNAIYFPSKMNSIRGYNTGYILAEKTEDNTGALMTTTDGGHTWRVLASTATNSEGNSVTFGSLKRAQFTDGYTYLWGENRTLIRASSSNLYKWTVLYPPTGSNTSFVAAAFKTSSSGIVTDGTNIYYTASAGDEWTTSTVPATVEGISSIAYAGGNTYFAVAKAGKVIKSTNSGYSWSIVNNGQSDVDFTAVLFQDADYGIIAGVDPQDIEKSSLWITFDGGADYVKVKDYTSGAFTEIAYINGLYAVSKDGQVVKSSDEGSSWTEIRAKDSELVNYFTITPQSVMYTVGDSGSAAICAPKLQAKFTVVQSTESPSVFSFLGEPVGYATSYLWRLENANSSVIALRNAVGVSFYKSGKVTLIVEGKVPGTSETQRDTLTKDIELLTTFDWSVNNVGESLLNNGIVFPEGQNLIGYIGAASSTNNGLGTIWKTVDGGNTWSKIFKSEGSVNVRGVEGISFPSINVGYACGWGEYKDSKQYKQVWKTIDGGTTWTELDLSGLDGYFNAKSSFMADIHFISETEGAVSNGTNIYVTKNGGATWTVAQVTSNIWNGEAVEFFPTQFCYADSTTLYSVGNTQVFKSVDGGLTWNIVKGGGPLYTAVDFRDANYGIAVTDESNLLWLTMDGGATWSTHTAPYLLVWSAVKFINDSTVYAAGFSDGMVKSTDGGFTWVEDNYPVTDGGIKNFYVTETGVVFASGSQGFVKRKVPGMNADFEYSKDGLSVSFTNRSMGFITTYKWEVDGVEKSTLKNPEIIFETGGTYQVKLTVSGVDPDSGELVQHSMTETVVIEYSGIEDSVSDNTYTFSVYPNPVVDKLNCTLNIAHQSDIKIIVSSVSGSTVYTEAHTDVASGKQTLVLDTASWSKGIYLVQLYINGQVVNTTKVVR